MGVNQYLWHVFPEITYIIENHNNFNKLLKTLKIIRDESYRLNFTAEGLDLNKEYYRTEKEKDFGNNLKITSTENIQGDIGTIFINKNVKISNIKTEKGEDVLHLEANGEITNLKLTYDEHHEEAEYIVYWFLNSNPYLFYKRGIEINSTVEPFIDVEGLYQIDLKEEDLVGTKITLEENSFLFKYNNNDVLFGFVNTQITNNLSGSFLRFSRGVFPTDEDILKIKTFLSFFIGADLINTGFTKYTQDFLIKEQFFISPLKDNINQILSKPKKCPIPISWSQMEYLIKKAPNVEEIFNLLFESYLKNYSIFSLDKMILYINISKLLPLDIKIQPLATALDLFQNHWFKSDFSKSKGKNLDDKTFGDIIKNYIENIENDLGKEKDTTSAIISKIKKANELTGNQKQPTVLNELDLPIGKVEKDALKGRNVAVHGTVNPDYQKITELSEAFITLLNRIILKALDYKGDYIDYSTLTEDTINNINDPLKGNFNNYQINFLNTNI